MSNPCQVELRTAIEQTDVPESPLLSQLGRNLYCLTSLSDYSCVQLGSSLPDHPLFTTSSFQGLFHEFQQAQ
jgi:hypothetical protein